MFTGMLSACGRATNPINPTIPVAGLSNAEMARCLSVAGRKRGWSVVPIDDHHMEATYYKGRHMAVLDITFDETMFSISVSPKTSASLMKDDGRVHRNVNKWITNFHRDATLLMADLKMKKAAAERPTSY